MRELEQFEVLKISNFENLFPSPPVGRVGKCGKKGSKTEKPFQPILVLPKGPPTSISAKFWALNITLDWPIYISFELVTSPHNPTSADFLVINPPKIIDMTGDSEHHLT